MIRVNLDVMLARRKMSSGELADALGITQANLSILKTNKGRAIRFSTLDAICRILDCQVADILEYVPEEAKGA
ncbi:MAG TPA: helix-turn-helix transcriptional regulator [Clostridia bacterium]|nr:helix-turn-helix transcriptional regulator [Clostridia bacterium]